MSKILDKDQLIQLQKNLVQLGFTEHEGSVYVALLLLGQVGSSQIIKMTGLHSQYVYQSLYSLEKKGLAAHLIHNGRKRFQAKHPNILAAIAEQQSSLAQSTVQQLEGLLTLPSQQQFDIFQGQPAYIRYEFQSLMNAGQQSLLCIIGGVGDHFATIMGPHLNEYERIRQKKGIAIHYLGSIEQKDELKAMKKNRPVFDYRLLPGLFTGVVNTNIWAEHIGLNLFGTPVVCFTITNKLVADSYRGFFNTLWEIAGK
ncbi:MAG: hypothetical protein HY817_05350 [Candidatus Abawacabacteria bacterium]|nr:hypothetical protein [Candidatus Abawacabacteria bacterium]